jgi:hypothetical protein
LHVSASMRAPSVKHFWRNFDDKAYYVIFLPEPSFSEKVFDFDLFQLVGSFCSLL